MQKMTLILKAENCRRVSNINYHLTFADRSFMVANATDDCSVVFVNEGFCRMSGYSRADVMQRPCTCEFLHGPLTSQLAIQQLREALTTCEERSVEILYYKKDGQ